jgi:hypothetical protein
MVQCSQCVANPYYRNSLRGNITQPHQLICHIQLSRKPASYVVVILLFGTNASAGYKNLGCTQKFPSWLPTKPHSQLKLNNALDTPLKIQVPHSLSEFFEMAVSMCDSLLRLVFVQSRSDSSLPLGVLEPISSLGNIPKR